MAKITRPNDILLNSQSKINLNTAARAGSGQIAQGQVIQQSAEVELQKKQYVMNQQLSSAIDAEGQKIFNESRAAYESSTLIDKMTQATESFIKGKNARYQQTQDANGNYTYEALPKDIENMGNNIKKDMLKKIKDPRIASQFSLKFDSYVASQKISALNEATKQQVRVGLVALDKGLGNIIQQASTDNIDQMETYVQQGLESLNEALIGGIISKEDYNNKKREFNNVLRNSAIRNAIANDRANAVQVLNKSAAELGISEAAKSKLDKQLSTSLKSDQIALQKARELQRIDDTTEEASIVDDLKTRIETDTLREDELIAMEDKISPKTFSELKKDFVKATVKKEKERSKLAVMSVRLAEGDSLYNVSSNDIDKLYSHMVEQRSHITEQEPTLSEEAQIAAIIPQPVKAFANKLNTNVLNGNPDNAVEMLAAYTFIKDRDKKTLDKEFDDDSTAIMEHVELLTTRGNIDPKEALIEARDKVLRANREIYKDRLRAFTRIDQFKDKNIEEAAASVLGAETFFGKNQISTEAVYTFKELAREGFRKTGDRISALNYAKTLMKKTYGYSEVTRGKQFMFNPPEKEFPGTRSEDLRNILINDVTPILPAGVSIEKVSIHSDDITATQMQLQKDPQGNVYKTKVPTWSVTYTTDVGGAEVEVPLVDPDTGQVVRWSPIGTKYFKERKEKALQKAKEAREIYLQEEDK